MTHPQDPPRIESVLSAADVHLAVEEVLDDLRPEERNSWVARKLAERVRAAVSPPGTSPAPDVGALTKRDAEHEGGGGA